MAKKKATHQTQDPKRQNPHEKDQNLTTPHQDQQQEQQQQHPTMEEPNGKLESLKSLNDVLLKDAKKRKLQVEALVKAKEALETELALSGEEKSELETELGKMSDQSVSLEIEKGLFCVFIETQLDEMGGLVKGLVSENKTKENEIGVLKGVIEGLMVNVEGERGRLSRVCRERDLLKSDFDNWVKEANGLKERVIELEKKEIQSEEEIGELKKQLTSLLKEKKEREKEIEEAKRSRDLAKDNLSEKLKEIDDLKREIEGIVRERNEIDSENTELKEKISELDRGIQGLNEIVSSLRKEEEILRDKVLELEKSLGDALEKENSLAREIAVLMGEKKENESTIARLMEEKDNCESYIRSAEIDMKDKIGFMEKLLREKEAIEEAKVIRESEIVELNKEVGRLRDDVFSMQEFIKEQEDKNRKLASEVNHYKDAFEQASLQRDNALRGLDEEKKNGMNLRSAVQETEKRVGEAVAKFAKVKSEQENLTKEKKEMEIQVASLEKEKFLVQKNFMEAQGQIDDLRSKMELAGSNSDRALTMLRDTVALVFQSNNGKEEVLVTEKKLDGEIELYERELEVIKTAFRNKETAVEEMKQQVEFLQDSVAKANKKNSIWTMVSSATTVVAAAASLAYVAKVR